jgi:hypothetical protein
MCKFVGAPQGMNRLRFEKDTAISSLFVGGLVSGPEAQAAFWLANFFALSIYGTKKTKKMT